MSSTNTSEGGYAPKHRACDECRTRKLACTKEPDGCARCKREGIVCHYSPQKQMGRPRKRHQEKANENGRGDWDRDGNAPDEAEHANKNIMVDLPPDTADTGFAFLSLLTGGDFDQERLMPTEGMDFTQFGKTDWQFGYTGNDFGQLNFDPAATAMDHTPSLPFSNLDPALFFTAEASPNALPTLSSGASSSSPESSESPPEQFQPRCTCTASLYLAIDSMQKLSMDVTAAVRQARLAAKTAYEVVNCQVCSIPVEAPAVPSSMSAPSTMQNFQNLMLLATLIPSIVHAYERILILVDKETAKAQAERREIPFKLQGYGGVWGAIGENDMCGATKMLEHRMMEPVMWRLAVRALLRVDVYGLSNCSDTVEVSSDIFHLGLKDIVQQMENQSKARHAVMNAMILSGALEDTNCSLKSHKADETPTCQRIIAIARDSIDNLVIA